MSAHLEGCAQCRATVSDFEEEEGISMSSSPSVPMTSGSLGRALAGLDREPATVERLVDGPQYLANVRLPVAVALAGLRSRRWLAPGLWAAAVRLTNHDGWRAFILHAPAGTLIPAYEHRGRELIAVLAGAFGAERTYVAGDFVESIRGENHQLRVTDDGECVCLISTQGRIKWRGWAKLIAPVLNI